MARLIVTSDIAEPASVARGGLSAFILQIVHGLERLGHDVFFLELLGRDPDELRPAAVTYFRDTMTQWWHADRASLVSGTNVLWGMSLAEIERVRRSADAVITIGATFSPHIPPLLEGVHPRILLEQDPVFTHIWADETGADNIFGPHDHYFTVGANIGTARCTVPTAGKEWQHYFNPVVLDWWPGSQAVTRDRFTTVADWRSYGYLEFEGATLGPKAEELRKFIDLPHLVGGPVEMALNIDAQDPDIDLLVTRGWHLESPSVAATIDSYREYVTGSLGEFSCAKGAYVGTRSGWFSDRSACYLASGRPVVLQATGFEDVLPTGRGLFSFRTADEAADAIRQIRHDYEAHSSAARQVANEYLDSDRVLRRILAQADVKE